MDDQKCDACPAPAAVRIEMVQTGLRLYFCNHHARELFPPDSEFDGFTFYYDALPVKRP